VLDGTVPSDASKTVCHSFPQCRGYIRDGWLPRPPYPLRPCDGYRQAIYEAAVQEAGWDHWFLLLHGDELWTFDPAQVVADHPDADGLVFDLPVYIPRDPWNDDVPPLDQLKWRLGPGYPELRMFHGAPGVAFAADQHFNVTPHGLRNIVKTAARINHYPWRSPASQRAKARQAAVGFGGGNYRHVLEDDAVTWTDEMIAAYRTDPCYPNLECDP
jgi:hypothetical protein